MRLVERMTLDPARCMACGAGNVPQHDEIGPFLDMEIEVGWGDSVYLCKECVARIVLLFGYMSPEDRQDLEAQVAKLEQQVHDWKAKFEEKERRLQVIREGSKALKAERRERKKVSTKS